MVFICDHHDTGQFWICAEPHFGHTLDELMNDVSDLKIPVFYGGPVQMDTIHFLHQYPDKIPGGYEVTNGIYWGGDFELAIELIKKGEIDPGGIGFTSDTQVGPAASSTEELNQKSWLTLEATRRLVFLQECR